MDDVAVVSHARDNTVANAFAALRPSQWEARAPFGYSPVVSPALTGQPARLSLYQMRTRSVFSYRLSDHCPVSFPLPLALVIQ